MEKLKVINLFGGPGTGKSTTRADLFRLMKQNQLPVEEVTEFAKDVTWDQNLALFSDQLFVLANQNRRLERLRNKVEWAVSDSPILLGIHYITPDYLPRTFKELVFELWDTYDNYNFYIERTKPYVQVGRNQNEDEAKQIDANILEMLDSRGIPYTKVKCGETAAAEIYDNLFGKTHPLSVPVEMMKFVIDRQGKKVGSLVKAMVEELFTQFKK